MKIDLRSIPYEGLVIKAQESSDIIEAKPEGMCFGKNIDVDITVNNVGESVLINGSVKIDVEMVCGRCLKKFTGVVRSDNLEIFREVHGEKDIDITGDIREEMILVLPLRPLCQADCRGVCPRCGQDLNEKKCSCKIREGSIKWDELDKLKP